MLFHRFYSITGSESTIMDSYKAAMAWQMGSMRDARGKSLSLVICACLKFNFI